MSHSASDRAHRLPRAGGTAVGTRVRGSAPDRNAGCDGIVYGSKLGTGKSVAIFDLAAAELANCHLYEVEAVKGHHILQLDDSPQSRQAVADALRAAGCPVDVSDASWFGAGKFVLAERPDADSGEKRSVRHEANRTNADAAALLLLKTQLKGFTDLVTAAAVVTEIHSFFTKHPEYLNAANTAFLEKYPGDFRESCVGTMTTQPNGLRSLN